MKEIIGPFSHKEKAIILGPTIPFSQTFFYTSRPILPDIWISRYIHGWLLLTKSLLVYKKSMETSQEPAVSTFSPASWLR